MSRFSQFIDSGILAYRALFTWNQPVMFATTLLISPIFQELFFVYLGRYVHVGDAAFYVVGVAALSCSGACVYGGTMAIANERWFGTLPIVLSSPARRVLLIVSRAIPFAAVGTFVAAVALGAGAAIIGVHVPVAHVPALLGVLLVAGVSASCFGVALGAIGLRARDVYVTANLAAYGLLLLTGAAVPASRLPSVLRVLGDGLPITHAIRAARQLVSGTSLMGVGSAVAGELAVAAGWLIVAVVLFGVFDRRGRERGVLDVS